MPHHNAPFLLHLLIAFTGDTHAHTHIQHTHNIHKHTHTHQYSHCILRTLESLLCAIMYYHDLSKQASISTKA